MILLIILLIILILIDFSRCPICGDRLHEHIKHKWTNRFDCDCPCHKENMRR